MALRAIAVLTVLVFHTRIALSYGWLGVELFFVLSGYLITSILFRSRSPMERRGGWWEGYAKPFYCQTDAADLPPRVRGAFRDLRPAARARMAAGRASRSAGVVLVVPQQLVHLER